MALLAEKLGYNDSPNFLNAGNAGSYGSSSFAHLFRKSNPDARERIRNGGRFPDGAELQGIYFLSGQAHSVKVPAVVVYSVDSDAEAREIHRLVWNQDYVPFVLVESPQAIRLYSGFQYDRKDGKNSGLLDTLEDFNASSKALRAESIDDGTVWRKYGTRLRTDQRVDWQLLSYLKKLSIKLQNTGMARRTAHAFIGRFVYLQYLKGRGFLSVRKLRAWGLEAREIFSRDGEKAKFAELNDKLNNATDGLNGAIFPFDLNEVTEEQYQLTAAAFYGDDPNSGQLALFEPFDFSYIPIETLSIIYEQFLHETDPEKKTPTGKDLGAYYTPLPLVNFLIAELEAVHPLSSSTKVLDPSCGSGAFLVQTYRRLIEQACRNNMGVPPPASKLREILERQIFGIDRDNDACRLAEMSLLITLLDYVDPPDLEGRSRGFKLPKLQNQNIFQADLFEPNSTWEQERARRRVLGHFDWVLGNPPWKELKYPPKDPQDIHALRWIQRKETPPVSGNQLAEAFVWKSGELLGDDGVSGMVLPAMTLFKMEGERFRQRLFKTKEVRSIMNFANLRYILFGGRAKIPTITLCYGNRDEDEDQSAVIQSYAPFLVEQETSHRAPHKKRDIWNITVDAAEVREIRPAEAEAGEALTWKLAMWGSARDGRLLKRIGKQHRALSDFLKDHCLSMAQGLELREPETEEEKKKLEHHPELEGEWELHFDQLKNCGALFSFPNRALSKIPAKRCWVRKGRAKLPYRVSTPPHIIADADRRFFVFSDAFIAVPARQIGISGDETKRELLKALSLFLFSDYCIYHQFFLSSETGVQIARNILAALKQLPVPDLSASLGGFSALYHQLEKELAQGERIPSKFKKVINTLAFDALQLRDSERVLIEDFVKVNLLKIEGRRDPELLRQPGPEEAEAYLHTLCASIEGFFSASEHPPRCRIEGIHDSATAFIEIALNEDPVGDPILRRADAAEAKELREARENLLKQHRQWIYFNRRLITYANSRLYLSKPFQRLYWTRRQAVLDADELIAEGLGGAGA